MAKASAPEAAATGTETVIAAERAAKTEAKAKTASKAREEIGIATETAIKTATVTAKGRGHPAPRLLANARCAQCH
jgi:hypothetical protein